MSNPTLPQILTAYSAAAALAVATDVKVFDGPVPTGQDPMHSLSIGHTPIPDEPGARIEDPSDAENDLPEWAQADVFTVTCTIEVKSGSTGVNTIPTLRTDAAQTLAAIRTMLKGESPLGLSGIAWARVGNVEYTPTIDQTGSRVVITFDTVFQSRTAAS
jgi:hypothetical protein